MAKRPASKRKRPPVASQKPDRDQVFLNTLRNGMSIRAACEASGYTRSAAYERRANDAAFAAAWDAAYEEGTDSLEDEAVRRGRDGVEKPIFYMGEKVATVREFSDNLLLKSMAMRRPEKWRERYEVKHTDDTADLTDKQLRARLLGVIGRDAKLVQALIDALQSGAIDGSDAPPATH